MSKTLWLSGGNGMVGSHALRHVLLNTDWNVVIPTTGRHGGNRDRLSVAVGDWCDKHESCKPIADWQDRVMITNTDLAQPIPQTTISRWGGIDYMWALAAESHVPRSITDPVPFVTNNVAVMVNTLEYARVAQPEIMINCSTDETAGPVIPPYGHSEEFVARPSNPYSASKQAADSIAHSWWKSFGVPVVETHCMNMIGETQLEKFTSTLITKIWRGETVTIHVDSTGTPGSRYYLHCRNLADAWLWITKNGKQESPDGLLPKFNIAGEECVDNLTWAKTIATMMGKRLSYELVDFHGGSHGNGHDPHYGLDSTKIHEAGWQMPFSLEETLENTISWTLAHPEWM